VNELNYLAALSLGLLGGSHCLVMCGGIGAAMGLGTQHANRLQLLLLFQTGRIFSYAALGAGLGVLLGMGAGQVSGGVPAARLLAASLLIAMGLYVTQWWRGLILLERVGAVLWRNIQPFTRTLLPVNTPRQALTLGLCWGFLPCGLIYSALLWSASATSSLQAALLMFCFGLGTLPVMLTTGLAGERLATLLRRSELRNLAGLALICFGIWTGYAALQHTGVDTDGDPKHHHGTQ
jgi:sulfite exporter TauE/SafE